MATIRAALLCAGLLPPAAAVAQVPPAAPDPVEATGDFGSGATRMVLRSTTDLAILRPVLEQFTAGNPDLTVHYEQWGSNALFADSRAACENGTDPADAVLSSAVQQMVWLVNDACALPYVSPATTALPNSRRWRDEVWGIGEEPAVILYNKAAISGAGVPRDRFALLDLIRARPDFLRGKIATYDIAESGLGYLFAHADSLEATTFGAMLEAFARVGAVATCCSAEIIRGVASGRYLIAYNVLGSYVAQDFSPDVGVILPEDYTLILSRGYLIPKQARHPQAAERLLDFLLSAAGQEALRGVGLVMPHDPSESGLLQSARRVIALSPTLLVALDAHRRRRLFALWQDAFNPDSGP